MLTYADVCSLTQVQHVVAGIKQKVAEGGSYKEMAVLYRTQKTGKQFQAELQRQEIPFNVHGVSFWRRKMVKTLVAVLRLVKNRSDDQAFRCLFKEFD
jgi:superfamily I DNA/RNA helicase